MIALPEGMTVTHTVLTILAVIAIIALVMWLVQ